MQEMGSLYVRGYSYQQMEDLDGLSWFPQLTSFSTDFSNPTALKVYQVTTRDLRLGALNRLDCLFPIDCC